MKKYAVVFPGQGSQSVGMLAALAQRYPIVHETFNVVSKAVGFDVWEVSQSGPLEKLSLTTYTQPAMLAAGVAAWRVWQSTVSVEPTVMAGHSLGEYTALVCAGACSLEEAAHLVLQRAKLMQTAVPEGMGAMAAVMGVEASIIADACVVVSTEDNQVWPVNYNSMLQTVVAGHRQAVETLIGYLKQKGAKKSVLLPVSIPSHCPLMQHAATMFAQDLAQVGFTRARVPILHNIDARHQEDSMKVRESLMLQLYHPVQWVNTVRTMVDEYHIQAVVECGPGTVLTSLNKRITDALEAISVYDEQTLIEAVRKLNG